MTFAQNMRIIWIDAVLEQHVMIRRADLCSAFGISTPQASSDIKAFGARFPNRIRYDASRKGYVRNHDFSAFPLWMHHPVLMAQTAVRAAPDIKAGGT